MAGYYTPGLSVATALAPDMTFAADTNLSGGRSPQTSSVSGSLLQTNFGPAVALTDGANIATNAALGALFTVTLAGNRTLDNPTNLVEGKEYIWQITQDGTGNRTLAYGSTFSFDNAGSTLSTAGGAIDIIRGVYVGTKLRMRIYKAFA